MSKKPSDPRPRPRIARSRLMVAVCRDIDHELRCAREFGLGAEVQTFSLPHILAGDFSRDLARMAKRLEAVPGPIGCHGPFIDTTHFSQELEVRAVARMRYLQAIDIAEAVGARYVLFHSQYNPLIKIRAYADIYHEGSMAFWPEILAEAKRRRLDVYLENMFDDTPAPLCRLARALDAPNLK
ncbi:MAG: hypothetical protein JXR94_13820, partial [Candidatus Hydrogenedentes bacterium]|nr:hypothetical protein [Candidatus Hydrogenedentota bacterium]